MFACRMNAEVLKSWPDILSVVSSHLYGQLEGFVAIDNTGIMQRWEVKCIMCILHAQ